MATLRAILLIAALQVRVMIKSVRFAACLLMAIIPAAIALGAGGLADAGKLAGGLSLMLLMFSAPLVGLLLGSVVIAEEVEGRTITFFVTRPIHRAALFLGRWLAVSFVASCLMGGSAAAITYGSSHATFREAKPQLEWALEVKRGGRWRPSRVERTRVAAYHGEDGRWHRLRISHLQPGEIKDLPQNENGHAQRIKARKFIPQTLDLAPGFGWLLALAASLGAVLYTIITASLSIFVKRPMIFGLAYAYAVEGILVLLPGSTQSLSVQHYLRSLLVDAKQPMWMPVFEDAEFLSRSDACLHLVVVGTALLAAGCWAVTRKQFVLTS